MKYSEVRDTIRSGDLVAFSHRGWKTWRDWKIQIIRFFTRSEYSHVGIAWVTNGRVMCLEAVVPKVRIFPLSKLGDFYLIPMQLDWTEELEEFALSIIGDNYSQVQAIQTFFSTPEFDKLWQCVEYVTAVFKKAGINISSRPTPTELVRTVQKILGKPTFYIENEAV